MLFAPYFLPHLQYFAVKHLIISDSNVDIFTKLPLFLFTFRKKLRRRVKSEMDFCPSLFLTIFFRAPLTIKLPSVCVHQIIFLLPPIFLQVLLFISPFFTLSIFLVLGWFFLGRMMFFLEFLLHFRMDQWLLNFGLDFVLWVFALFSCRSLFLFLFKIQKSVLIF